MKAPPPAHRQRAYADLIADQKRLAGAVIRRTELPEQVDRITGVDVAFPNRGQTTRAAAVTLSFPDLKVIEQAVAEIPTRLPYIPGLLSFRELPALLAALEKLNFRPDLVLCDGQGIAHPRRFGVASHLGVETGLCTIGVGKSRLCGQYEVPGPARGECSPLAEAGETIGIVVRTRARVRPVFVSVGHRLALEDAVQWVLACSPRYRIPEPIRQADRLAGSAD